MLDLAIQKAMQGHQELEQQVRMMHSTKEKNEQALETVQAKLAEEEMAGLMKEVKASLKEFLARPPSDAESGESLSPDERIRRAAELFGSRREAYLSQRLIREVMDDRAAACWYRCVEMADRVGRADLFGKISGEQSQVWGRLVPTQNCALQLISTFQDWAVQLVTDALKEGGEGIANEAAQEWLKVSHVSDYLDLQRWKVSIPELGHRPAIHLHPGTHRRLAQRGMGAIAAIAVKPMSWSGVLARERVAAIAGLRANQYYLGDVPPFFPSGIHSLTTSDWQGYASSLENLALDAISMSTRASVERLLNSAYKVLQTQIEGGEGAVRRAEEDARQMGLVVQELQELQRSMQS